MAPQPARCSSPWPLLLLHACACLASLARIGVESSGLHGPIGVGVLVVAGLSFHRLNAPWGCPIAAQREKCASAAARWLQRLLAWRYSSVLYRRQGSQSGMERQF